MRIETKLEELGLVLPSAAKVPPGVEFSFPWVRRRGSRLFISGHGPQLPDGELAGPYGKVGADLTVEQGYQAARLAALSILGSLKRELGDLDRVVAWLRVFGMVNAAPDFTRTTVVINGFSELILQIYGQDAGAHARSAVGVAALPFGLPVVIEAEVEIAE